MENPVKECADVTAELYKLLEKPIKDDDRERAIQQIEFLLERRDQIIAEFKAPFTEEQKRLGYEIVNKNKVIDNKLKSIFMDIQGSIQEINKKKTNVQKYVNPYQSYSSDGVYYDRKN